MDTGINHGIAGNIDALEWYKIDGGHSDLRTCMVRVSADGSIHQMK